MVAKSLSEDLLLRTIAAARVDPELSVGGQFFSCNFLLASDAAQFIVRVHRGQMELITNPFVEEWQFAIKAPADTWAGFLEATPPAGYHDVWAAAWAGRLTIEGDLKVFMQHHLSVWRFLKLLRREASGEGASGAKAGLGSRARADTKPVGRYVDVEVQGLTYEVFYLENGNPDGIPLLCQHTAGAHNHQFRNLLRDRDVTRKYRVIAYDLPYHGKSDPPEGKEWWKEEYKLTAPFFKEFVVKLAEALRLDKPVYMGCSMGGVLALHLHKDHADSFRAIIGVESADWTPGFYTKWWAHPEIDGRELVASVADGLIAPHTSELDRRLTMWYYSQGAPGVVKGDLYFYSIEHDMRESAARIDTTSTPLYLLTGEYDYLSTPLMSRATAEKVKGAEFRELRGLGHFPMSENHERFMESLGTILDAIAARSKQEV